MFFAELIRRLGIADEVNAKATIIPSGLTAELAARGEVELAVQQVSELMLVPGIDVVGPLPPGAESVTMFSAGVLATSVQAEAALELIAYLRSSGAAQALTRRRAATCSVASADTVFPLKCGMGTLAP